MADMFKVPKQNPPSMVRIEPFLGLDLSATESQISDHNSPDMLNLNIDERGSLNKRVGYERAFESQLGPEQINGLFSFKKPNGATEIIVLYGSNIYKLSDIGG